MSVPAPRSAVDDFAREALGVARIDAEVLGQMRGDAAEFVKGTAVGSALMGRIAKLDDERHVVLLGLGPHPGWVRRFLVSP